jgi:hypothetical protein
MAKKAVLPTLPALLHLSSNMDIGTLILIIIGLGLFETITSIDNAIINAQVLSKMQPWARRGGSSSGGSSPPCSSCAGSCPG